MCELFAAVWPEPVSFGEVLPWACAVEQFGIAGFGWGVAWVEGGSVRGYRDPGRLGGGGEAVHRLSQVRSRAFLVHLRRPSRLSTVELDDTQPFVAESGEFAFCHNGLFASDGDFRERYRERLRGRADSEVGFRLCEDLLADGLDPEEALASVHRMLGGTANLGYLDRQGTAVVYSGFSRNAVWSFRQGDARLVSTRLHSLDESVFDLIFRDAQDRRLVDGASVRIGSPQRTEQDARSLGSAIV